MGGVMNGMAAHRGIVPVGGTFFVFSDYMRGAVRLAALSDMHVIYSWTHDSVGLGQDGPTHQPIEQLAAMRAMPDLRVVRPADANETAQAWRIAVDSDGPTALILSRQDLPVLADTARLAPEGVARGAYVLRDAASGRPGLVLIGTGSEVHLCLAAADLLATGRHRRPGGVLPVVGPVRRPARRLPAAGAPRRACPAWPSRRPRSFGWERYADATVCIDRFGASAPGDVALRELGFTPEHVAERATALLGIPAIRRRDRPGPPRKDTRDHPARSLRPAGPEPLDRQPAAGLAPRTAPWPAWWPTASAGSPPTRRSSPRPSPARTPTTSSSAG